MRDLIQQLIESEYVEAIPSPEAGRLETLESQIGLRFPRLYRQLLREYAFGTFELGGIEFFGNTGFPETDIYGALFADKFMSPVLLDAGYLQFGRPDSGS